ncbi:glycosyltransferase family 2 protein [Acidicapsa acidisoli]|uniref:glycosyltransferase family 2 protein n=1 Tax=Acidicapsa acidisoli TaxID=1615681 RepID=UPI0021DFE4D4|nr:glycosyltransferase family A protein [Acidicapsa acidisoli]
MMKIIVNCGPAELYIGKCLASIRSQSCTDWEAYVTIDPCGDRTAERAYETRESDSRIHIHVNATQQFSMVNLIQGVQRSGDDPEDILIVLDGDDWFATEDSLKIIRGTYRTFGCWMTYGSWISDHAMMPGRWPAYPDGTIDFRTHDWLGTAVRTWKRWLWDHIDDRDFRDATGNYFRVTEDQAAMLPMLEMSGTRRAKHIADVLMIYNRSSPFACAYVRREEMLANAEYLKSRPRYRRLETQPVHELAGESLTLPAVLS